MSDAPHDLECTCLTCLLELEADRITEGTYRQAAGFERELSCGWDERHG